MKSLILLTLLLAGCSEFTSGLKEPKEFKLSNGQTVWCKTYRIDQCGLGLSQCHDDIEYFCQIGVERRK